jgi:hypothetical protein
MSDRFTRQIPLFGEQGQRKLSAANVAVVGIGGLGSHVVQQLALLGVGRISMIDPQELADTDRNRSVVARYDDPVPGSLKLDLAERTVASIDPNIQVTRIPKSLISDDAFAAVLAADYVFGCLDSEGLRLVLNELTAAYELPLVDLASDVLPGDPPAYGGRICVAWGGDGCLVCRAVLDLAEAQLDLSSPEARRDREALYGVKRSDLGRSGPSVVSVNGVVASLGVTEFMVAVTGIRAPKPLLTWYGHMARLTAPTETPVPDCHYCKVIRGKRDVADVQRYVREGVGSWLV